MVDVSERAASDPDTHTPNSFLVIFGTVAALFLVAALFIASIASTGKRDDLDERRAQQRRDTRQKLEQAEHEALTTAGWVDKTKGVVRVPIAQAMKSTVADFIGQWAPTFLLLGLYNKIVKLEGNDRFNRAS